MARAIVLTTLLLIFFRGTFLQAQWVVADTSGTVAVNTVTQAGVSGYIAMSDPCYRSIDAGQTWTTFDPQWAIAPLPLVGLWREGVFTDANNGLLAGGTNYDNGHEIVRTTDGGLTWEQEYIGSSGIGQLNFNDMQFPLSTHGYAVGTNGRMVRSTNGGMTWTTLNASTFSELNALHFSNGSTGVIAGDDVLKRTVNGGSSWSSVQTVAGHFVIDGIGNDMVVCGPGTVMVSTDAGATWTSHPAPVVNARRVIMLSTQSFAVLDVSSQKVLFSHTGGASWEEAVLPLTGDLRDMCFLDANNGCVVGKANQRSLIMVTSTGLGPGIPLASVSSTSSAVCGSTTHTFEALNVDPSWSLTWLHNGVPVGNGTSVQVTYTASGPHGVALQMDNGVNLGYAAWSGTVVVNTPVTADAGPDVLLCSGNTTTLSVALPPGGTVQWSPATGLNLPNYHSPTVSGLTTPITYTATIIAGLCSSSDQVYIDLQPAIPEENWTPIYPGSPSTAFDFADDHHGFASQTNNLISRTTNGGLTWHLLNVSSGTTFIRMADAYHGYRTIGNAVYHTTDGWNSEELISSSALPGCLGPNRYAYPKDRDTAIVYCKQLGSYTGSFARTVDGGISWSAVGGNVEALYDLEYLSGGVVLASGGAGTTTGFVLRSTDNGATWSEVSFPVPRPTVADIEELEDGSVLAVSGFNILRSLDQGLTWDTTYIATSSLGDLGFQGLDSGFIRNNNTLFQTVNGGACWQAMSTGLPSSLEELRTIDDAGTFILASPGFGTNRTLYRNRIPAPGLGFTLYGDTLCVGSAPPVYNNSSGYTSYQWRMDGTLVSTNTNPSIPAQPPGDHELMLIGTNGLNTDTVVHAFHVQEFMETPTLSLLMANCWASDTVPILAQTNAAVSGYRWYRLAGLNMYQENASGAIFHAIASSSTGRYLAQAVSPSGCLGPLSDTIFVPIIPRVSDPTGPLHICQSDPPHTTTHITSATTSSVIGFVWSLSPPSAGTLTPNGNTCSIAWDPLYEGQAAVLCSGFDTCGTGPVGSSAALVDIPPVITLQSQSVVVDEGFPFTLGVITSAPSSNSMWYQDGQGVLSTSYSYFVNQATLADAGNYYWTTWLNSTCGHITSDTIAVTVLPATGLGDVVPSTSVHGLKVTPNPFASTFTLHIPELQASARLWITDATGRQVLEQDVDNGPARSITFDVPVEANELYHIHLSGPAGHMSTPIMRAR